MTHVIVDQRERPSGIVEELAKRGLEVEVKQLITADFILQTKDRNNNIVSVGIEKKTQEDFISSIIDRRIIQQLVMLKENFTVPLLIIEGSRNMYTLRNFHPNAIRGMLASIAIDFQIPMINTKSIGDTAALIEVIAKRLDQPKKYVSLLSKRKPITVEEQQEYLIESLPGIGPQLARSLLKGFGSVKNIINASEKELQKIEKIGKKKAEEIVRVAKTEYKE